MHLDLFYDYRTNVTLYPQWQEFLRKQQPKTLIFWGQNDIFFTREGGEAYLQDLPQAEMHRLDSGHFAVEDSLDAIARGDDRLSPEEGALNRNRRIDGRDGRVTQFFICGLRTCACDMSTRPGRTLIRMGVNLSS